jgi:dihydrofolate reductase
MGKVTFDITMSLDGLVAGPDVKPGQGLGKGGERLHEWAYELRAFREPHGREGGEENRDSAILEETMSAAGAVIMGRGMFGGAGSGPWGEDDVWGDWNGWWGDEPPFGIPVFVLTHHPREPLVLGETTFTFVTDGIGSALEQARAAAGERDVGIGGGADTIQQYLRAGLVDEFQVHVAPFFLGRGVRLFDELGEQCELEIVRVVESPVVTHLRYRLVK